MTAGTVEDTETGKTFVEKVHSISEESSDDVVLDAQAAHVEGDSLKLAKDGHVRPHLNHVLRNADCSRRFWSHSQLPILTIP